MSGSRVFEHIRVVLLCTGLIGAGLLVWVDGADAAKAKATARPASGREAVEQIDVGTQNVLERLKLLRVQMALDREEIEALRLRMQKISLQRQFDAMIGSSGDKSSRTRRAPASNTLLVKAISLQPRKEAIVMYRGKMYNVRPGDTLAGGLKIKDITEGGIKVVDRSGQTNVR